MDRTSSTDRSRVRRTSRTEPRRPAAARATAAADAASASTPAGSATGTVTLERQVPTAPVDPVAAPAPRRRRSTPRSVVRPRAPRHRMLLVCTAILAAGLLGVLVLNTIIGQGAFRQHELEIDLILTSETEEALARAVQKAESPLEVERRARALGMVPAAAPVFLRLSDGKIMGEPVPAPAPAGAVDFADAPGMMPSPSPRPQATGAAASPGAADPATGIDPALDPLTGLEPTPSPAATAQALPPDATSTPAPATSPAATPTPTTEGALP